MILNIIGKIYSNENFINFLLISIVVLAIIFAIVFLLGIRDIKKSNEPETVEEEDLKDFSFDIPEDADDVKEDVTFEMPSLTKNLEDFKRSIEEEMRRDNVETATKTEIKDEEEIEITKPTKILDIDEIEDTSILPKLKNNKTEG